MGCIEGNKLGVEVKWGCTGNVGCRLQSQQNMAPRTHADQAMVGFEVHGEDQRRTSKTRLVVASKRTATSNQRMVV